MLFLLILLSLLKEAFSLSQGNIMDCHFLPSFLLSPLSTFLTSSLHDSSSIWMGVWGVEWERLEKVRVLPVDRVQLK